MKECYKCEYCGQIYDTEVEAGECESKHAKGFKVVDADFGNKIAEIADHYGFDSQSHMLIEEMAELAQAINKLYRAQGKGQPTTESKTSALLHIYEELADVEICVEQIKHLLSCRGHVDAWKEKKVERQLERIRREKAHDN